MRKSILAMMVNFNSFNSHLETIEKHQEDIEILK